MTKHPSQLKLVDSGGGRWAALNTAVAPFDDLNVRKAVLAGFDREAALLALGGKRVGTVANHFLPPGVPGLRAGGRRRPAPVPTTWRRRPAIAALAASYMKKAGYASGRYSGEPILMVGPVDGNGRRISEIAKQAFTTLGFEVKLRLMSQQAVMTKYCGAPAAAVAVCPNVGWTRDFADGQTFLDPTFNGEHITPVGNANVSQLDVPAVNEAIDARDDADRPGRARRRVGRGRPRDHGAGPGRAARMGQGADGGLGGRERRGQRESRRLGLLFHVFAVTLQQICGTPGDRPGLAVRSPARVARLARRTTASHADLAGSGGGGRARAAGTGGARGRRRRRAERAVRLPRVPARAARGGRGRPRRPRRPGGDAHRVGQVALLPAAGADADGPDAGRLAAGVADAGPGGGAARGRARPRRAGQRAAGHAHEPAGGRARDLGAGAAALRRAGAVRLARLPGAHPARRARARSSSTRRTACPNGGTTSGRSTSGSPTRRAGSARRRSWPRPPRRRPRWRRTSCRAWACASRSTWRRGSIART